MIIKQIDQNNTITVNSINEFINVFTKKKKNIKKKLQQKKLFLTITISLKAIRQTNYS